MSFKLNGFMHNSNDWRKACKMRKEMPQIGGYILQYASPSSQIYLGQFSTSSKHTGLVIQKLNLKTINLVIQYIDKNVTSATPQRLKESKRK